MAQAKSASAVEAEAEQETQEEAALARESKRASVGASGESGFVGRIDMRRSAGQEEEGNSGATRERATRERPQT